MPSRHWYDCWFIMQIYVFQVQNENAYHFLYEDFEEMKKEKSNHWTVVFISRDIPYKLRKDRSQEDPYCQRTSYNKMKELRKKERYYSSAYGLPFKRSNNKQDKVNLWLFRKIRPFSFGVVLMREMCFSLKNFLCDLYDLWKWKILVNMQYHLIFVCSWKVSISDELS